MERTLISLASLAWAAAAGVGCGGDDKPGEIPVDDATRADAVSASRGLGFRTNATLTIDEALSDLSSILAVGGPLEAVMLVPLRSDVFKPSSSWTNLGTCSTVSSGAISLTGCALGGGDTLDGSVSYGAGRFQADVTVAPYLRGTYESSASLQSTGSHVTGTGKFARDLIPAAAPPDGLHEVAALDIDVGFDGGCPTSGSIRLTVTSNVPQGTSTLDVDYGPDCGDARFYP